MSFLIIVTNQTCGNFNQCWQLMLYSHNDNTKFNERTNETLLFYNIYISHFILEKGPQFVVSWEIDGETYTQREDFFPFLHPGVWWCQHLQPLASRLIRGLRCLWLAACLRLNSQFSALCLNLTARLSHGLFPVTHLLYPTALIRCHPPVY